jgi:hypothetical protein
MIRLALLTVCVLLFFASIARAEDNAKLVKRAVEESTLDQPGMMPFHLRAEFAPSQERDNDSHRTGTIEVWWESPSKWRRVVQSPEFSQILIVNGESQWQKNEGDYFPEWLRELAVAIVRPIPLPMNVLLECVKNAEVKHLMGQTNFNWSAINSSGDTQGNGKGYLALIDNSGFLFYTGGVGWSGSYKDFKDFHGHKVAYSVASGYVEVTAKVTVLEDLGATPSGFFDVNTIGSDVHPIETVVLTEEDLRRNLIPGKAIDWPALKNGPLEGVVWTEVVLDRTGKIREMIPPIADNPGVAEAAERGFRAMQFQTVMRNGEPVQALARLSVRFKTVRPAGTETFESARSYFEKGWEASLPAAKTTTPYVLRAEFQVGGNKGIETGRYEDTLISASEWKREAWIGSSHLAHSRVGEKHYKLEEGPGIGVLRLVMQIIEPIPTADTMTESDWRIKRDTVNGTKSIRVFRGPADPNEEYDPGHSMGYWFDESGRLVKFDIQGLEIVFLNVEAYSGVEVARRIEVVKDGKLALRVVVKEISPANATEVKDFKLKGYEWQRAFTAEVR